MVNKYKGVPIRKIEDGPVRNKQFISGQRRNSLCGMNVAKNVANIKGFVRVSGEEVPIPAKKRPKKVWLVCKICDNKKPMEKHFDKRKDKKNYELVCKKCKSKHPNNLALWSEQDLL